MTDSEGVQELAEALKEGGGEVLVTVYTPDKLADSVLHFTVKGPADFNAAVLAGHIESQAKTEHHQLNLPTDDYEIRVAPYRDMKKVLEFAIGGDEERVHVDEAA